MTTPFFRGSPRNTQDQWDTCSLKVKVLSPQLGLKGEGVAPLALSRTDSVEEMRGKCYQVELSSLLCLPLPFQCWGFHLLFLSPLSYWFNMHPYTVSKKVEVLVEWHHSHRRKCCGQFNNNNNNHFVFQFCNRIRETWGKKLLRAAWRVLRPPNYF